MPWKQSYFFLWQCAPGVNSLLKKGGYSWCFLFRVEKILVRDSWVFWSDIASVVFFFQKWPRSHKGVGSSHLAYHLLMWFISPKLADLPELCKHLYNWIEWWLHLRYFGYFASTKLFRCIGCTIKFFQSCQGSLCTPPHLESDPVWSISGPTEQTPVQI